MSIFRVNGTHTFPSSFMFIAAMNPCPCGYYSSSKYRCTDYEIIKYRGKARNTPVQVYVSKTEPNHQCMVRPAFCDMEMAQFIPNQAISLLSNIIYKFTNSKLNSVLLLLLYLLISTNTFPCSDIFGTNPYRTYA